MNRELPPSHAIESINKLLSAGMPSPLWQDAEVKMLGHAMGVLRQVERYKGGVHLEEKYRDNTCDHTLASVRLATEFFADAASEDVKLKHAIINMIMVHDIGEAFGEFTSLDSRVKTLRRIKIPKRTERDITDFILSWGYVYRDDKEKFDTMISDIQKAVGAKDSPEAMARAASEYMLRIGLPDLSFEGQRLVNKWMHYFDEVEGLADKHFAGAAAKMIEKLQSQEHFAKYSGVGDSVPFDQATSASVVATLSYAERKLGDLFTLARTEEERSLADILRERCYKNIIAIIDKIPPLIQMREPEPERDPQAGSSDRAPYLEELLERHRKARKSFNDPPLCTETRYRLLERYKAALENKYIPAAGSSIVDEYLHPTPRERVR